MVKGCGGLKRIPIKIIETQDIYESIRCCAREIGGNHRGIHDCLNGKRPKYLGYTFEFVENIDESEAFYDD